MASTENSPRIFTVEVQNKLGLRARPSAKLSQLLRHFESAVCIMKGDKKIEGKDLLKIMTMGAKKGTLLIFEITGPDAEACEQAVNQLFTEKFGEEA